MNFAEGLARLQRSAAASSSSQQQQRQLSNNGSGSFRENGQPPPRKRVKRARWNENNMRLAIRSIRPYHSSTHHCHDDVGGKQVANLNGSSVRSASTATPSADADDSKNPSVSSEAASACDTIPNHEKKKRPLHICLLMICIGDLPFEHIWKEWASSSSDGDDCPHQVSFVCHAKYPNRVQSEWLRQRLLIQPPAMGRGTGHAAPRFHTRRPEWGSIEITRAMWDLLMEGLLIGNGRSDPDPRYSTNRYHVSTASKSTNSISSPTASVRPVDKFIFVSESCLPITTLSVAMEQMSKIPLAESWVNARNSPNNGYSRQLQFDRIHHVIPSPHRHKADQWMMLSREHADFIMDMDRRLPTALWECFSDTRASDELYFPTSLSLAGILATDEVRRRRVTYADWSESVKNPASFAQGKSDLSRIRSIGKSEGCLFARKFTLRLPGSSETTGSISVEEWKESVEGVFAAPEK